MNRATPAVARDAPAKTGLILVDHGSRRAESNAMLPRLVERMAAAGAYASYDVIEPAHMELAEPSLMTAFDRCVAQGAQRVIVFPYFLSPGRHWDQDIPALAAAAAARHPGVTYLVTAPLGFHQLLPQIISDRIDECVAHAAGGPACELCEGSDHCRIHPNG